MDASAKQTAGIILLGLAVAWFIGSVAVRTLGIILSVMAFCLGLYVAVLPIWNERESVLSAAQEYDSALTAISEAVHKEKEAEEIEIARKFAEGSYPSQPKKKSDTGHDARENYNAVPPGAVLVSPVQIPEVARKWVRPHPPDVVLTEYATEFGFPDRMPEQDIMREIETKNLLPRPTFSVRGSIASHRIACIGGGSLSLLGFSGFVLLVWQARNARSGNPAATLAEPNKP